MVSERVLCTLLLVGLNLLTASAFWRKQTADPPDIREPTLKIIRSFIHGQGEWADDYIFSIKRNLDLQLAHDMGERKAVSVILYCTTNKCDNIVEQLRTMTTEDKTYANDCMHYMRGHSQEHEDLGGRTQKLLVDALGKCPNGVIVYDALQGMTLSEAKVLVNVLSEGGSLIWEGKMIQTTNSLLFLVVSGAHKGHFGIRKTWLNLRSDGFRWENDYEDVKNFVQTCDICQQFRQLQRNVDLGMIDSPIPNHTLCLDFVGPLPRGRHGYRFIATGIDAFTKFGTAQASKTCSSSQIIKLLKNWFTLNGPPQRILCDNGAAFISKEFESFCERHGVDIIHTPAYSHKSAGTVEAYNKNFVNRLKRIWKEKGGDWTEHINECTQEINRTVHCTTLSCPRYLLKGINRNGGLTNAERLEKDRNLAYERIRRAHELSAARYAKNVKQAPLREGMEVSWYNFKLADRLDSKLYSKWKSPCILTKKRSEHRWDIELPDGSYLYNVHRDFLQPFRRKIGGPML